MSRRIWVCFGITALGLPVFASSAQAAGKFTPIERNAHTAGWLLVGVVVAVSVVLVCGWLWQAVQSSLLGRRARYG